MGADLEQWKRCLIKSIQLFCRNFCNYENEAKIDGLLAITLDKKEVVLVKLQEVDNDGLAKRAGKNDKINEDQSELLQSIFQYLAPGCRLMKKTSNIGLPVNGPIVNGPMHNGPTVNGPSDEHYDPNSELSGHRDAQVLMSDRNAFLRTLGLAPSGDVLSSKQSSQPRMIGSIVAMRGSPQMVASVGGPVLKHCSKTQLATAVCSSQASELPIETTTGTNKLEPPKEENPSKCGYLETARPSLASSNPVKKSPTTNSTLSKAVPCPPQATTKPNLTSVLKRNDIALVKNSNKVIESSRNNNAIQVLRQANGGTGKPEKNDIAHPKTVVGRVRKPVCRLSPSADRSKKKASALEGLKSLVKSEDGTGPQFSRLKRKCNMSAPTPDRKKRSVDSKDIETCEITTADVQSNSTSTAVFNAKIRLNRRGYPISTGKKGQKIKPELLDENKTANVDGVNTVMPPKQIVNNIEVPSNKASTNSLSRKLKVNAKKILNQTKFKVKVYDKKMNKNQALKKKRKKACGTCGACLVTEDCKTCRFCLDMRKYGGLNILKKKCHLRQCQNLVMRM